jgi:NADH:ubiquinone oxidoreductase subunit 6 (subunit J)
MPSSFYICAAVTLAGAFAAMTLRNLVHCALSLAISFIGVATLFLHLNAPFAAFAQILVYVGAVAILIVFAILLTKNSEAQEERGRGGLVMGIGVTTLVAGAFVFCIMGSSLLNGSVHQYEGTTKALGQKLMSSHVIPLEIMALLLTAAMLGAVILALPEKNKNEGEQ